MICQANHPTAGQHLGRGVFTAAAGLRVNDIEHPLQGLPHRLTTRPTGKGFGHRIETRDRTRLVGGDHPITDRIEGDRKVSLAL